MQGLVLDRQQMDGREWDFMLGYGATEAQFTLLRNDWQPCSTSLACLITDAA